MASYLDNLDQFDAQTISRGKTYFAEGRVSLTHVDPHRVEAYVEGSERYRVTLSFNGNKKLASSRCDCPCQFPCKHVVAVLYALEDKEGSSSEKGFTLDSFSETLERLKIRGSDFDFFTLGQSLLLSIGSLSIDDKKKALRLYFGSYSLLGNTLRYDYRGLTGRLLKASELSDGDLQAFFKVFLEDDTVSAITQKNLLRFLFDAGGAGLIFDETFLAFSLANEGKAHLIFRDSYFLGNQLQNVPDDFLAYLLEHGYGDFSAYDLSLRFPKLNENSTEASFALYLALIETLERQNSLSYAPREAIALFEKLGRKKEAEETARLYYESSFELTDYIAYRQFFKNPLQEGEIQELAALAVRSAKKNAIFLYESYDLPSFPKADISSINLEDFGTIGNHFDPTKREEVLDTINGKIDNALSHVKKQKDIYDGLLALAAIDPQKAEERLRDPAIADASLLDEGFRSGYLALLVRFSLLEKMGFHAYPSEAKHVS